MPRRGRSRSGSRRSPAKCVFARARAAAVRFTSYEPDLSDVNAKMVMLVVITAVDGAPRIEIRTSAFCTAAAIRHLKASQWERERHQDRAARVKAVLNTAGLPVMSNDTHIVPLMVGDPEKCKEASDEIWL